MLLALIPIICLALAMRDYHGGIGNKILNPPVPVLSGLLWDFVGFPGLLAIPFLVYSYEAVRRTEHKKTIWGLAIILSVVIFRWGFWLVWWLYILVRNQG